MIRGAKDCQEPDVRWRLYFSSANSAVSRFDRQMARTPRSGRTLFEVGRELLEVGEYDRAAQAFVASAEAGNREGTSLYNAACA